MRLAERELPEKVGLFFCISSLLVVIPLFAAATLTDSRIADDFRLVGRVDFARAASYFSQTAGFGRNEYRPMVLLSFSLDKWIWGERAFGYHLTNVLIHAVNAVLLFLVLRRLTGSLLAAFCSSTLFAIQPVNHSRIAWIAARDGSVSMLFLLISWLAYFWWRDLGRGSGADPSRGKGSVLAKEVVSWSAFLLALLSYEAAVIFPFVLVSGELLLASHTGSLSQRIRQAFRATLPYFVLLAAYVAWWLFLFHGEVGGYDLNFGLREMAHDFNRLHRRVFYHLDRWVGLVYLVIAVLLWRERQRVRRFVCFSFLLIWIGYLPFLPLRGHASRFAYFSSVGAALLLGLCATGIGRAYRANLRLRAALPALLLLILVGYYGRSSSRRFRDWVAAGVISETIPAQLRVLHPAFPPDATLVFDQIPPMHGDAVLFMNSFRAAVRSKYSEPIPRIFYYPTPLDGTRLRELMKQKPAFYFRYLPRQQRLVEVMNPGAIRQSAPSADPILRVPGSRGDAGE